MSDPRATRTVAILATCLLLGAGCSNTVFDKCVSFCQHVFYDCSGVIKIGNEILTASDYPACQQRCYVVADGGGICQDPGAAFDCLNDISCEIFNPAGALDAGAIISNCETKGKCGN